MAFRSVSFVLFSLMITSCSYTETAYIPTAPNGVNPPGGCPGRDKYLEASDDFLSTYIHVFQSGSEFVISASVEFHRSDVVDWREAVLRDAESDIPYTPKRIEKIWYSDSSALPGVAFNHVPVTGPVELQNGNFYLYFPAQVRKFEKLEFTLPKSNEVKRSSPDQPPLTIQISRLKRQAPFILNC